MKKESHFWDISLSRLLVASDSDARIRCVPHTVPSMVCGHLLSFIIIFHGAKS